MYPYRPRWCLETRSSASRRDTRDGYLQCVSTYVQNGHVLDASPRGLSESVSKASRRRVSWRRCLKDSLRGFLETCSEGSRRCLGVPRLCPKNELHNTGQCLDLNSRLMKLPCLKRALKPLSYNLSCREVADLCQSTFLRCVNSYCSLILLHHTGL